MQSFANSSWVLGSCFQALASRNPSEWKGTITAELGEWTTKVVRNWGWSSVALSGLVAVLKATSQAQVVPLSTLYPDLATSLLSHSHALRLAVLRLLTSPVISAPSGVSEVLKRCLQGEEVSLDVSGSRERVLRIGRLPQFVRREEEGEEVKGADVAARWLTGNLFSLHSMEKSKDAH